MIPLSDIGACLVTRGDVDMHKILDSIEEMGIDEVVVWNNAVRPFNAKVFGRYLAILETRKPVIFIQDDDCIVTCLDELRAFYEPGKVVANMVTEHRRGEPPMLGWGALFARDLPWRAFEWWCQAGYPIDDLFIGYPETIFTALTPCVRLNIGSHQEPGSTGHVDLPWAHTPSRSHRQPDHHRDFALVLERARAVAAEHPYVAPERRPTVCEIYMAELDARLAMIDRDRARASARHVAAGRRG